MKLNRNSLITLIEEVINEEENESHFPSLKTFKSLGRGVMENEEPEDEVLLAEPDLIEESGDTLSMKEFRSLMKRVSGIFSLMPLDRRRTELKNFGEPFGLMYLNDFMRLQNNMTDAQKGKLDDRKK